MPWYPSAVKRPIKRAYRYGRRTVTDSIILHVSGSPNATSLYGWWNNPASGDVGCHFYIAKSGTVEQYAPTEYLQWTSSRGSLRSIGIETQGGGSGTWTAAQAAAITRLLAWLCRTHSIPVRRMTSSRRSQKGIGYHRLGVNPWRVSGGESWSSAYGKVCPGAGRIAQIPAIVASIKTSSPAGGTTGKGPKTMRVQGKEYYKPYQKVGGGKWRVLDVGNKTKSGSRTISLSSGNSTKHQLVQVRASISGLQDGDYVDIQVYHLKYNSKGSNGPVKAMLRFRIKGGLPNGNDDSVEFARFISNVPKGHRVRIRAKSNTADAKIGYLDTAALQ